MLFIFNLAKAIAWQVEAMYKWLVSLIIGELIHGERHDDSKTVILAFSIFIVLAVFSFYMEEIVGLYTFIGIASLVLCQLNNLKIDVAHNTGRELLTNYFHESCLVIFLLVFNSFLPKAGHFIMFWAGPWFGLLMWFILACFWFRLPCLLTLGLDQIRVNKTALKSSLYKESGF